MYNGSNYTAARLPKPELYLGRDRDTIKHEQHGAYNVELVHRYSKCKGYNVYRVLINSAPTYGCRDRDDAEQNYAAACNAARVYNNELSTEPDYKLVGGRARARAIKLH